jgi:hypothetical protein
MERKHMLSSILIAGLMIAVPSLSILVILPSNAAADYLVSTPGKYDQNSIFNFSGDTSSYRFFGDAVPTGDTYMLFDDWEGTWYDAEKSPTNTDDDLMCWAAASSNILQWSGWGEVTGMSTSDDIFQHFLSHWTDDGGWMEYGLEWWFDGTSEAPAGSFIDTLGGGGFYLSENFSHFYHENWIASEVLLSIDVFLHSGYGVTLGLYGPGGHAVTCWGFNHATGDPSNYIGIWITDSDDDKSLSSPPDRLRYYEVSQISGLWYLQNFYGSNSWYIGAVEAIEQKPTSGVEIITPADGSPVKGSVSISGTASTVADILTFSDNFEGGLSSDWIVFDSNGNNGFDYWGDTTYRSYDGSSSVWCAGEGTNRRVIYSQNFNDAGYIPSGWETQSDGPNSHPWDMRLDSGIDYRAEANSFEAGPGTDITEWLFMSLGFSAISYTNLQLQFYLDYNYYNGDEFAQVLYATDASYPMFYSLGSWVADTTGTQNLDLSAADGASQVYLAFRYHGTYDWYMRIDDITVSGDYPNSYSHNYDDYMDAFMCYPVSLSDGISAHLSYKYWLNCEIGFDYLSVAYYEGGLWNFIDSHTGNSGGWQSSTVSVPISAEYVGFRFHSDSSVHFYEGAYIDQVNLVVTRSLESAIFISTDGGSLWHPASGTTSWSYQWDTALSSDGAHAIQARAYYGTSYLEDIIGVVVDNSPPSGSVSINGGSTYTNTTYVILTLIASDSTSGVKQVRYSNDSAIWTAWQAFSAIKSWTLPAGDGTKTVYYQVMDNADLSTIFSDTIVLDTTVPSGSIVINSGQTYTNVTAVTLTLTASDTTSGVNQVRYSNDGVIWSSWEAFSAIKSWTLSAGDGTQTVYYQVRDNANKVSIFSDTIVLDASIPSGSISINSAATYTSTTSVTLTLTAIDVLSGVKQVRYSDDGAIWTAWEAFSSSKDWNLETGDGTKTVYYQVMDNANELAAFSDTIILDTTAPTGSVSINAGTTYTSSVSTTLTLAASDALSGVKQIRYSNDSVIWSTWEAFSASKAWNLMTGDGIKIVYYQIMDNADNLNTFSDTIILDTAAPSGSIVINSGQTYTNLAAVTLTLTANDDTSGIQNVRFSNDTVAWSSWQAFSAIKSWTLPAGDGTKTVYYQVRDNAGNSGTFFDSIILDMTSPSGSIEINSGAIYANFAYVGLTVSASDLTSGVELMRYCDDNLTWTAWEPYTTEKTWILQSGDGPKELYVQFKDKAGVISSTYSDTIVLDETAPTLVFQKTNGLTVSINGPSFAWNCTDKTSGVSHYEYSIDGGQFILIASSTEIDLKNLTDGTHNLIVRAVDNAGNTVEQTLSFNVDTNLFSFSGPMGPLLDIALIGAILGGILIVLSLVRRRRKDEDKGGKAPQSLPPAPPSQ